MTHFLFYFSLKVVSTPSMSYQWVFYLNLSSVIIICIASRIKFSSNWQSGHFRYIAELKHHLQISPVFSFMMEVDFESDKIKLPYLVNADSRQKNCHRRILRSKQEGFNQQSSLCKLSYIFWTKYTYFESQLTSYRFEFQRFFNSSS